MATTAFTSKWIKSRAFGVPDSGTVPAVVPVAARLDVDLLPSHPAFFPSDERPPDPVDEPARLAVPALWIPANTLVLRVILLIAAALEGDDRFITIGDGDAPNGWVDTGSIADGTAGMWTGDGEARAAYSAGRYYPAASTINAVIATGLTSGSFYVLAEVLDLSGEV